MSHNRADFVSSDCEMEVLNFQIKSLASLSSVASELPSNVVIEITENEALEEKSLREVDLSEIIHFKRVVRRPLPRNSSLSSGKLKQVEILKSFRVSMEDPVAKVLPAALLKYNIVSRPQDYSLYIVYGNRERRLSLEEKPLIIFKQLDKEGKKPMFMLRKNIASDTTNTSTSTSQATSEIHSVVEDPLNTPDAPSDTNAKTQSFRVRMEDPCYKVLPAALKKYNITADWQLYDLYIVYGDTERCMGLNEKPLLVFKQLDKEGVKPMFMLRKKQVPGGTSGIGTTPKPDKRVDLDNSGDKLNGQIL